MSLRPISETQNSDNQQIFHTLFLSTVCLNGFYTYFLFDPWNDIVCIFTVHSMRSNSKCRHARSLYYGWSFCRLFVLKDLYIGRPMFRFSFQMPMNYYDYVSNSSSIFFLLYFSKYSTAIFVHLFIYIYWFFSPVFPTRTTYTPSSSNLHYFTNTSPSSESQMWSTTGATTDDYDRPKSGALPDFQRLTNSYYASNGRATHINYTSQVVSAINTAKLSTISHNKMTFVLFSIRMTRGEHIMKRARSPTMVRRQAAHQQQQQQHHVDVMYRLLHH